MTALSSMKDRGFDLGGSGGGGRGGVVRRLVCLVSGRSSVLEALEGAGKRLRRSGGWSPEPTVVPETPGWARASSLEGRDGMGLSERLSERREIAQTRSKTALHLARYDHSTVRSEIPAVTSFFFRGVTRKPACPPSKRSVANGDT